MRVLSNVLKIGLIIIIIIYLLALPVVIISLWNVPLAKNIFWFLEISPEFPSKIIAGFTAVLAWATILLAFFAFRAIESSNKQNRINRNERILDETIRWSTNVLRLNSDLYNLTEAVRLGMPGIITRNIDNLYSDAMSLRDHGKYVSRTATLAGRAVKENAENLQTELTGIASLLDRVRIQNEIDADGTSFVTSLNENMEDTDINRDTIERHREQLAPLCNSIIDDVAQAKLAGLNNLA